MSLAGMFSKYQKESKQNQIVIDNLIDNAQQMKVMLDSVGMPLSQIKK